MQKMPKYPFAGPDVETVLEVQVISLGYNLVKMWPREVSMPNIRILFRRNAICCGRKPALVLPILPHRVRHHADPSLLSTVLFL